MRDQVDVAGSSWPVRRQDGPRNCIGEPEQDFVPRQAKTILKVAFGNACLLCAHDRAPIMDVAMRLSAFDDEACEGVGVARKKLPKRMGAKHFMLAPGRRMRHKREDLDTRIPNQGEYRGAFMLLFSIPMEAPPVAGHELDEVATQTGFPTRHNDDNRDDVRTCAALSD